MGESVSLGDIIIRRLIELITPVVAHTGFVSYVIVISHWTGHRGVHFSRVLAHVVSH